MLGYGVIEVVVTDVLLIWGVRNFCDRRSSDFPLEHSIFMAYEACICQDM